MKTSKTLLLLALLATMLSECYDTKESQDFAGQKMQENSGDDIISGDSVIMGTPISKWLVYKSPINGYQVSAFITMEETELGEGTIYLEKNGKRRTIEYKGFIPMLSKDFCRPCDTLWLDYHYMKGQTPYFDTRDIVFFDDFDFDGNEELCTCDFLRDNLSNYNSLDCESFFFYKDTPKGFVRMKGKLYDEMAEGCCRTVYEFDMENQTLTLHGSCNAFSYIDEVYYFKDGRLFKEMEIKHDEMIDEVVDDTIYYTF